MNFNDENIEAYLTGKMNAADKATLEAGMRNDPMLKGEVDLQRDIIESLKTNRKIQLKNRLNNINVSGTTGVSSAVKVAASFITVGMIGAGIYYMSVFSNSKDSTTAVAKANISEQSSQNTANDVTTNDVTTEQIKKSDKNTNTSHSNTNSGNSNSNPEAVANVPDATMLDGENNINKDVNLPKNGINESKSDKTETPEVGYEKIKNLSYRYEDGKLFLSQEFEQQPYFLKQFNTSKTKQLFLNFDNKYYELKPTKNKKSASLSGVEVKDASLLAKLRALQ
jgi:hypothetical protein